MIHWSAALSQIKHCGKGAGYVLFCSLYSLLQFEAFRQIRRNGAGQRTTGTMRIRIMNALTGKPFSPAVLKQIIIGIIKGMPSFQQNCTSVRFANLLGRLLHFFR